MQLVLIDGPIGGPRGTFEHALLGLASSSRHTQQNDEMVVASQLLSLLAKGGEEPAEPLGRRSRVELFIASEDDVGVDLAREHLPRVHIHRVCGGHREILRGRSAGELAKLVSDAWEVRSQSTPLMRAASGERISGDRPSPLLPRRYQERTSGEKSPLPPPRRQSKDKDKE